MKPCADCQDPGLCSSLTECQGEVEAALTDAPLLPEWDAPEEPDE